MTRTRGYPCASSESRSRASSSVRPTVATTRSNDGSSRGTGRRLRDVRASRASRHRAPRRSRWRALSGCGGRERTRPDVERSRASRGRRRVDRSHVRDTRGRCGSEAPRHPQRRAARARRLVEPRARRGARRIHRTARRRRRRATPETRASARSPPLESPRRRARIGGSGDRRRQPGRPATSDADRGRRRSLGGAVQLAVLPPVGVRRSGSSRAERAPLRHELRGERGLRAVVAPARRGGR